MVWYLVICYHAGLWLNCKNPSSVHVGRADQVVVEIINSLCNTFRGHTRKCSDVADKVRLVIEVKVEGNVHQAFVFSTIHEFKSFVNPLDPDIQLWGNPHCLFKPLLELTL